MTNAVYLASLVNSTGYNVTLSGATVSSGTGISFPATQSASSDANTLDDYEEGTWTPTFSSYGSCSSATVNKASYIKIGSQVTLLFNFGITITAANSFTYFLFTLPFNQQFSTNNCGSCVENNAGKLGCISGYGTGSGQAYVLFPAVSALPTGVNTLYAGFTYQTT